MVTIAITMDEAQRILNWRQNLYPKEENEFWSEADDALVDKLLDFVDR